MWKKGITCSSCWLHANFHHPAKHFVFRMVDYRPVNQPAAVDLSVSLGALRLSNPVIAASGTFGYGIEFSHLTDLNKLGGIVVKGLSLEPMEGAAPPRLVPAASGMLNAVGLQNIGVRRFISEKLPALAAFKTQIIANVFGNSVAEYAEVVRHLESAEGLGAYELNISCPNVACGGIQFGSDPRMADEVVSSVRKIAHRPLWVKLSPNAGNNQAIAKAIEEAGGDALTVANTYPAMAVDVRTRRSRLGRATGGLSGPAIKPITLRLVYDIRKAVRIPVIGLGGIECGEDALEYMVVGASAIQVGTASFSDPRTCERIVSEIAHLSKILNIHRISELTGSFLGEST